MSADSNYRVWAADNVVYGPIPEQTLVQWILEGRVLPDTWIYNGEDQRWRAASELELFEQWQRHAGTWPVGQAKDSDGAHFDGLTHEELRQFPIFSSLSDDALSEFVSFAEVLEIPDGGSVVKKGDPGDALFLVLGGLVRVRVMVAEVEKVIGHIPAGEFFGEMVMFRQGVRSADVVSEGTTRLLRLGLGPFQLLMTNSPALAVPVLFGIARGMADRLAEDARRFQQDAATEFLWLAKPSGIIGKPEGLPS